MGRSTADTPTSPEFLRVSDVDRDRAVDELKQEFVDGRLSHDTFMIRMHAALGARNSGQLSGLLDDLPPGWAGSGPLCGGPKRACGRCSGPLRGCCPVPRVATGTTPREATVNRSKRPPRLVLPLRSAPPARWDRPPGRSRWRSRAARARRTPSAGTGTATCTSRT